MGKRAAHKWQLVQIIIIIIIIIIITCVVL